MNAAKMSPRKPADSATMVSELMMPHQVNNLGHVFGGVVLSMVDRAAAVAAMRHSGHPSVTVSIDRVDFKEPIQSGEFVTCLAQVNFVGRTSMEVGVRVEAENLLSGVKRHTTSCLLTFVAIDHALLAFLAVTTDRARCPDSTLRSPRTPGATGRARGAARCASCWTVSSSGRGRAQR